MTGDEFHPTVLNAETFDHEAAFGADALRKWHIIDDLRRSRGGAGAQSYLQISTPSTSQDLLARIELGRFTRVAAFTYATTRHHADMPWTRSLATLNDVTADLTSRRERADIVFVDPWHSYDDSIALLQLALRIVNEGGSIVVHDCNPPYEDIAIPVPGPLDVMWCGDTWRAFIDVCANLEHGDEWFVVDADLGVGVISLSSAPRRRSARRARRRDPMARRAVGAELDHHQAWSWLEAHRADALRLVSADQWRADHPADQGSFRETPQ